LFCDGPGRTLRWPGPDRSTFAANLAGHFGAPVRPALSGPPPRRSLFLRAVARWGRRPGCLFGATRAAPPRLGPRPFSPLFCARFMPPRGGLPRLRPSRTVVRTAEARARRRPRAPPCPPHGRAGGREDHATEHLGATLCGARPPLACDRRRCPERAKTPVSRTRQAGGAGGFKGATSPTRPALGPRGPEVSRDLRQRPERAKPAAQVAS